MALSRLIFPDHLTLILNHKQGFKNF